MVLEWTEAPYGLAAANRDLGLAPACARWRRTGLRGGPRSSSKFSRPKEMQLLLMLSLQLTMKLKPKASYVHTVNIPTLESACPGRALRLLALGHPSLGQRLHLVLIVTALKDPEAVPSFEALEASAQGVYLALGERVLRGRRGVRPIPPPSGQRPQGRAQPLISG